MVEERRQNEDKDTAVSTKLVQKKLKSIYDNAER